MNAQILTLVNILNVILKGRLGFSEFLKYMARLAVLGFLVVSARYVQMGFNVACEERNYRREVRSESI